jgi:hypothetical protein
MVARRSPAAGSEQAEAGRTNQVITTLDPDMTPAPGTSEALVRCTVCRGLGSMVVVRPGVCDTPRACVACRGWGWRRGTEIAG